MPSNRYFFNGPEPKRVLDVGLDLDGCFYAFESDWYDAAVRFGVFDPDSHPFRPAQTWAFYEAYGMDAAQFLAVCHRAADEGVLWGGPVAFGGRDAWQAIAADGHRIHVKTDRSFGSHPLASEVATRIWLHSNRLPFDTITFTADKTTGPQVDVMLDDKVENYDALAEAGVRVWLRDQPWNQDDGTRRRVYSLDEFVVRVKALAAMEPAGVPA